MAGQADGSIIIDTELSSDGFKAGSAELLAAIKALSEEVKKLSTALMEVFNKPLTPQVNTSSAEDQIAVLEAQVHELETAMEEMRNTGSSAQTTAPEVSIGGTTKKASDLQRQIDSVNSSVERLAPTFQKAMSGSESSMTSFESKASALENKIAELQQRLEAVGQTKFPTQEYQEISAETEKAGQKLETLLTKQEKMQSLGVKENSAQWKNLQYDLDAVAQKYDRLVDAKARMEASSTAFQLGVDTTQYAQMEATLSAAASRLEEMRAGASQSEGHMSRLSGFARSVASHIGRAAKSAAGALVQGIKSAASHMAKMVFHGKKLNSQFGGLISGAKKFTLGLLGARGVYTLLRKAVSAYMAENQQLSNTLSACWSGIGNLLGPIITKLINLVAQAVAYVTSFLKLVGVFGSSASNAISSAGSTASEEADDLKRKLASFDELNVLKDNNSDSSASNSNVELPNVTLPDWANLLVEQIKSGDWSAAATTLAAQLTNMIASVDWAAIGQKLGYYLNGALLFLATSIQQFDWKALASSLATMFNNILGGVDWANLGTILTAKWAIILQTLDGFFGTLSGASVSKALTGFMYGTVNAADWVGIAASLSQNISKFISEIDFSALAEALSMQIRTALQGMTAAINNVDWAMIGRKVADFLNGIDWSGIFSDLAKLLGSLLVGALNLLGGFVEQVDWIGLADEIWACLESLTKDIDWGNFGELLGSFVSGAVIGVLDLIGSLFGDHDWGAMIQDLADSLGEALCAAIENIDWMGVLKSLVVALVSIIVQIPSIIVGLLGGISDLIAGLFEAIGLDSVAGFFRGIGEAMRSAGAWLKENLVDPVVNWVKGLLGIHSPSTVFAEIGTYLIEGLLQGIKGAWSSIVEFFSGALGGIVETVTEAWESVKSFTSETWESIKSGVSGAWNGIKSTASNTWKSLKTTVSEGWNSIKTKTSNIWSSVKSSLSGTWSNIKSTASSTWGGLKASVSEGWSNIKSDTSSVWSNVKSSLSSTWSGVKSTASSTWSSMKSTASSAWSSMKSTATSTWSSIKSSLSSTWSSVKSTASSTWNSMKSTLSGAWSSVKSNTTSTWSSIKSSLSSTWSSIKSTASTAFTNIKSTIQDKGWSGVGSNICSGISNGISSGWNWLTNKVSSLASSLLSTAKSALGIHSPSRLFRDEVGLNIGLGIGEGVEDSEPSVLKSVTGVADAIAAEVNDGSYTLKDIVPVTEVNGAITNFTGKIADSFTTMLDRLQAIAESVTFRMPVVATGAIPHATAAYAERMDAANSSSGNFAEFTSDVDERLSDLNYQLKQILAVIKALNLNIDLDALADAITQQQRSKLRNFGGV